MRSVVRGVFATLFTVLLVLGAATPASAAGFGIFEQGAKAMGMAGAFTAQADDGSALFHNVGGLGFLNEREFQVGFTFISGQNDFVGGSPFPGAGVTEEQEGLTEVPPHFYWIEPINDTWKFGLAVNAPFGLVTEWEDPQNFTGRFLSTKAALTAIDLNPNLGWQVSPRLSVGAGLIVRFSEVELRRNESAINPFTEAAADVANVLLESDFSEGFGWQVGFLNRVNNSFSWGVSYRSEVDLDFDGEALLTQIPTGFPEFDGLVAAITPFDQKLPITTSLTFPAMASLGVAVALSRNWLVEVDYNYAGWGSVDRIVIDFDALDDTTLNQQWDDVNNYRLGLRWTRGPSSEWRFGYVYDENPIPDETLGPLLPDSDRNGFTIGYGRTGNRFGIDLALLYLPFKERTITTSEDNFNGTYDTTAWLASGTLSW